LFIILSKSLNVLKNYVKAINGSIEEGATKDQAKLQIHEQESYDIHGGD